MQPTVQSDAVQIVTMITNMVTMLVVVIGGPLVAIFVQKWREEMRIRADNEAESKKLEIRATEREREAVKVALEKSTATAAEHADEVKQVLKETTSQQVAATEALQTGVGNLAIVAKASHTLLNSGQQKILRERAEDKRTIAKSSGLQSDWDIAAAADKDYQVHVSAQAEVDSQFGTDEQKRGDP